MSITVTTAAQFPALPDASVTVRVTLLEPRLAQVKLEVESEMDAIPQLSVELLFTWAAVTVTLLPTSAAVTF